MFITETNETGPRITSKIVRQGVIAVYANGVEIGRMTDEQTGRWSMPWNDGATTEVQSRDPHDILDWIDDIARTQGQSEFCKMFRAYPPVTFVVLDIARENATQDSPVRLTWAGREVATLVLVTDTEGRRVWAVLNAAGDAPLTSELFFTWGFVADWINAHLPVLLANV